MTLIGPECGHLLFCTLSACAALAQVKEKEKFFSLGFRALGFQSAIIWNPEYKTGLIYVVGQGDGRASSAC